MLQPQNLFVVDSDNDSEERISHILKIGDFGVARSFDQSMSTLEGKTLGMLNMFNDVDHLFYHQNLYFSSLQTEQL